MEKKAYDRIKALKTKVENGTATFQERNVYRIIQKEKEANKPFKAPR